MGSSEQKFYKDFNQEVPRTISKTDWAQSVALFLVWEKVVQILQ